jgi:hypothetical protein
MTSHTAKTCDSMNVRKCSTVWNLETLPINPKRQTTCGVIQAMGWFHNYSFGNIVEIAQQKPDATWWGPIHMKPTRPQGKERHMGIRILGPVVGIRRNPGSDVRIRHPFVGSLV